MSTAHDLGGEAAASPPTGARTWLTGSILLGAAVAVAAGVYGRMHDPAGSQTITLFFGSTLAFKAWTTTLIAVLASFQLFSALRIYGRLTRPRRLPAWFGDVHRLSGTAAFALSLPVAYHCLWSIGFGGIGDPRRFAHSILGCLFYGAFATKILAVRSRRLPGRMLPVVGALVFVALIGLWLTSSVWFFARVG